MFDLLVGPRTAERRPSRILIFAIALSIISSWLALAVNQSLEGWLPNVVAFISIGAAPLLVSLIWLEERKCKKTRRKFLPAFIHNFLSRHGPVVTGYLLFFVGVTVGISLVFILLPADMSNQIFQSQIHEIEAIRHLAIQGKITEPVSGQPNFGIVLFNNLKVLAFALIFSFIYGAGAVYIITWNASIIGVFIGITTRELAGKLGIHESLAYLISLPTALASLGPHGIPEITGYLVGGLAGGMMSAAILRGDWRDIRIIVDILEMVILSVFLIVLAALIECSY